MRNLPDLYLIFPLILKDPTYLLDYVNTAVSHTKKATQKYYQTSLPNMARWHQIRPFAGKNYLLLLPPPSAE